MAEGEQNKENPYSFHNFVKRSGLHSKNARGEDIQEDGPDLVQEPDLGISRQRENGSRCYLDDNTNERVNKRDDTSFSMKQFLSKDLGTRPKVRQTQPNRSSSYLADSSGTSAMDSYSNCQSPSRNRPRTPDYPLGLPDFVQDHLQPVGSREHMLANARHENNPDSLPDFALNLTDAIVNGNSSHCCSLPGWSQTDHNGEANIYHGENSVSAKFKERSRALSAASDSGITGSLPDFLSDGPMLNNQMDDDSADDRVHFDLREEEGGGRLLGENGGMTNYHPLHNNNPDISLVNGDNYDDASRLRLENEHLHRQLRELRLQLAAESRKVADLNREKELQRRKDTEETCSLEGAVQQVELNLKQTTERAVKAESNVNRLKQEVRSLHKQVSCVLAENEMLRSGDVTMMSFRQKAQTASDQITAAAHNAEQTLRQLLTGVESLRVIGAALSNIDKVSDADFADYVPENDDDVEGAGCSGGASHRDRLKDNQKNR